MKKYQEYKAIITHLQPAEQSNLPSPDQSFFSNLAAKKQFSARVLNKGPIVGATFISLMSGTLLSRMDAMKTASSAAAEPKTATEDLELELENCFNEAHGSFHGTDSPVGLSPPQESRSSPKA